MLILHNIIWCGRETRLSWTRSTRPSTVPVYQFQHDRNMSHNKLMTTMFQIDNFNMEFTQEVQKATDPIYQKISKVMPEIEWSSSCSLYS